MDWSKDGGLENMPMIKAVEDVSHASENTDEPISVMHTETNGAIKITLANGDYLVIGTSEWCDIEYFRAGGQNPGGKNG